MELHYKYKIHGEKKLESWAVVCTRSTWAIHGSELQVCNHQGTGVYGHEAAYLMQIFPHMKMRSSHWPCSAYPYSASFFSRNSAFFSQQFNRNSVFQPVSDQRMKHTRKLEIYEIAWANHFIAPQSSIQSLLNSDDNRMKASKAIILYQRDELDQFK